MYRPVLQSHGVTVCIAQSVRTTDKHRGRHNATSGLYSTVYAARVSKVNSAQTVELNSDCMFDSRQQTGTQASTCSDIPAQSGEGLRGCWVRGSGIRLCCRKGHVGSQLNHTLPLRRACTDGHTVHLWWRCALRISIHPVKALGRNGPRTLSETDIREHIVDEEIRRQLQLQLSDTRITRTGLYTAMLCKLCLRSRSKGVTA